MWLWEALTGRHLGQLQVGALVRALASSPDGQSLVVGADDGAVRLWDLTSGKDRVAFRCGRGGVQAVAFAPDGRTLAFSGWAEDTVQVGEAASGKVLRTLRGHAGRVGALAWSPDGRALATGGLDQTARLWDAGSGRLVRTLEGHEKAPNGVECVLWSPDGKSLAANERLWEVESGKLLCPLPTAPGHPASRYLFDLTWSPGGRPREAAVLHERRIELREAAGGKPRHAIAAYPRSGLDLSLAWAPDGKTLASASYLWDTASGRVRHLVPGKLVAWSPDGKAVAAATYEEPAASLWDAATGKVLRRLEGHTAGVYSLAWSPDGKVVATGSADRTVRLWEAASGRPLGGTLEGHAAAVWVLSWSPDGTRLASFEGAGDGLGLVWDAASGKQLHSLRGEGKDIRAAAWSPDGKVLFVGKASGPVRLWDAGSGEFLPDLKDSQGDVHALAWVPDGKRLAVSYRGGGAKWWDYPGLRPARTQDGPGWGVFSPDGRLAASGGGHVRVWETETGRVRATLVVITGGWWFALSPEGQYRGGPGVEEGLVYVVQTDQGQETLRPEEFAKKYRWENDPGQVRLSER